MDKCQVCQRNIRDGVTYSIIITSGMIYKKKDNVCLDCVQIVGNTIDWIEKMCAIIDNRKE